MNITARWKAWRRARHIAGWRCRCGRLVMQDGQGCWWHDSVRRQCLDGRITTPEDAR